MISSLMVVSLLVPTSVSFAEEVTVPTDATAPSVTVPTASETPIAKLPKTAKQKMVSQFIKDKVGNEESINKAISAGLNQKQILWVNSMSKQTGKTFDEVLTVFLENGKGIGATIKTLTQNKQGVKDVQKDVKNTLKEQQKKVEEAKKKAELAKNKKEEAKKKLEGLKKKMEQESKRKIEEAKKKAQEAKKKAELAKDKNKDKAVTAQVKKK